MVTDSARGAVQRFNRQMQPTLDAAFADLAGRPVDQVAAVLGRRWHIAAGKPLPDGPLRTMATAISDGRPVRLDLGAG